ncbi:MULTISPECIES: translation elongation factor Ts [Myxococcus]|uniref:Elongation factor Ts n=1 Tax=Myxococcus xanthus TaxID=34 RepID=A0A7Y4IPJ3_MYXXA|nr:MULTISPECIES: translation elongation factor Ts [Myxococcus]NOJ83071.1 translation elongation factor Ts [Myxococcus xanthus]NOJ90431.1 translation elongation factor Ts [Myxococcus xanthus]WNZ60102.1 translation elongation factor Ts [Myxococcus sp. MxC21-1]
MAEVSAQMVKELRERTNAGMMDCKKALAESGGDFAKAEEWLRKKGIAKAAGKEGRVASEGVIGTYVHSGRIGVIVEVNCETDFVARNPDFQDLVKDVAMQIAAAGPKFVRREEVPTDNLDKEKDIQRELLKQQGKPEAMLEKILVGKMEKYYEGVCLVDQLWVKDDKKKVGEMISERAAKIGEKVSVRRFVRYELGEGIEKKKDDLAAEVAKTLGQA